MTIAIGKVCAMISLGGVDRDKISFKQDNFGELLIHNITFVLPRGYGAEGKYACLIYDSRHKKVSQGSLGGEALYVLDEKLEDYLTSQGVNLGEIKGVLLSERY